MTILAVLLMVGELRKVSAACGPREKAPPRSTADSGDRVVE